MCNETQVLLVEYFEHEELSYYTESYSQGFSINSTKSSQNLLPIVTVNNR